jgi:hypothetical protein
VNWKVDRWPLEYFEALSACELLLTSSTLLPTLDYPAQRKVALIWFAKQMIQSKELGGVLGDHR